MSRIDGRKVVLATFAGRRDRMELLTFYVREAIRQGLIDEWHVWDFTRKESDAEWLRTRFPVLRRTPSDDVFRDVAAIEVATGRQGEWNCAVRARHDAHIVLLPRGEDVPAQEFVVGGWSNERSAHRPVPAAQFRGPVRQRDDSTNDRVEIVPSPGVLSDRLFRDIKIRFRPGRLELVVDSAPLIARDVDMPPGTYDVRVNTNFGADGEWRFPGPGTGEYLFVSAKKERPVWLDFYRFYAARAVEYADHVILKCDDDMVYLQLDRLEDFIRFRLAHREWFLVSANVINNNICAYNQQAGGAIPHTLMELELPDGGFGGTLWANGTLAEKLHDHFLDDRAAFERLPAQPISWTQRLSINFISWMGRDSAYMSAYMNDDEHSVSIEIPRWLRRPNCIYPGFLASHLTFHTQDNSFDHARILQRYRQLADEHGILQ